MMKANGMLPAAPSRVPMNLRGALKMPTAVITGSSSGIGNATAKLLAQKGWRVYAGVRKQQDLAPLGEMHSNIYPILLDLSQPQTILQAKALVEQEVGSSGVQALINNAGKGCLVPLKYMPMDMLQDQLQTNLVGAIQLTQAFLPLLRGPEKGRIVNLGSLAGTVALPLFSAYSLTKFGLEALSDLLRYELAEQGIRVVLIKAGPIKTPIWDKSLKMTEEIREGLPPQAEQLYGQQYKQMIAVAKSSSDTGLPAEEVAAVILTALTVDNPRSRYLVGGAQTTWTMTLRRLLPDWLFDKLVPSAIAAVVKDK